MRALATTPVKSLSLQPRSAVRLEHFGVVDDRRFFLIDDRGRMVNGKQIGILSAVVATYDHGARSLKMTFPDGRTLGAEIRLAGEIQTRFFSRQLSAALVLGPWAAALSEHAGRELRLVMAPLAGTGVDRGLRGAVSIISRASVENLEQVASREVDSRRFRMLIELDGLDAHAEDAWVGRQVTIGEALVAVHGHVGRCLVTGQDPDSGVTNLPTLELLRSYRPALATTEPLAFGIYGEVLRAGLVRIGDLVQLSE